MLKSGLRLAALVCVVLCCMGPATMQTAKGSDATTTETGASVPGLKSFEHFNLQDQIRVQRAFARRRDGQTLVFSGAAVALTGAALILNNNQQCDPAIQDGCGLASSIIGMLIVAPGAVTSVTGVPFWVSGQVDIDRKKIDPKTKFSHMIAGIGSGGLTLEMSRTRLLSERSTATIVTVVGAVVGGAGIGLMIGEQSVGSWGLPIAIAGAAITMPAGLTRLVITNQRLKRLGAADGSTTLNLSPVVSPRFNGFALSGRF